MVESTQNACSNCKGQFSATHEKPIVLPCRESFCERCYI